MKNKRAFLFRAGTVLALLIIAGVMLIVGRGHTVFFDNKTFEAEGGTIPSFYKTVVYHNDEKVAELMKRERGMATWTGQNFRMEVEVTREKGGEPERYPLHLKLPYSMDGIIVNLPAMLAGLPAETFMSEFVAMVQVTEADEEIILDYVVPSDL